MKLAEMIKVEKYGGEDNQKVAEYDAQVQIPLLSEDSQDEDGQAVDSEEEEYIRQYQEQLTSVRQSTLRPSDAYNDPASEFGRDVSQRQANELKKLGSSKVLESKLREHKASQRDVIMGNTDGQLEA